MLELAHAEVYVLVAGRRYRAEEAADNLVRRAEARNRPLVASGRRPTGAKLPSVEITCGRLRPPLVTSVTSVRATAL